MLGVHQNHGDFGRARDALYGFRRSGDAGDLDVVQVPQEIPSPMLVLGAPVPSESQGAFKSNLPLC